MIPLDVLLLRTARSTVQGETEDVHDLAARIVDSAERFDVPQLRFDAITQNPARSVARLLTDSGIIPPLCSDTSPIERIQDPWTIRQQQVMHIEKIWGILESPSKH